jgi:hypothetical protein
MDFRHDYPPFLKGKLLGEINKKQKFNNIPFFLTILILKLTVI